MARRHRRGVTVTVVPMTLLLLLTVMAVSANAGHCPSRCVCQGTSIDCSFRGLSRVPWRPAEDDRETVSTKTTMITPESTFTVASQMLQCIHVTNPTGR
ncbi:hypothetical protein NP493_346g00001 [Ridgeia piscesae]|uniref:LRRNT domain-containing protein n=1 Tax=Ridgeia piscesae TaxID=27915 RepID=A0AAD9L4N5_RIDPI|nr:hypothetical protein NP493_346g00001 [Ridgeia piscesae]